MNKIYTIDYDKKINYIYSKEYDVDVYRKYINRSIQENETEYQISLLLYKKPQKNVVKIYKITDTYIDMEYCIPLLENIMPDIMNEFIKNIEYKNKNDFNKKEIYNNIKENIYKYIIKNLNANIKKNLLFGIEQLHKLNIIYININENSLGYSITDKCYKILNFSDSGIIKYKQNTWEIKPSNSYMYNIIIHKIINSLFDFDKHAIDLFFNPIYNIPKFENNCIDKDTLEHYNNILSTKYTSVYSPVTTNKLNKHQLYEKKFATKYLKQFLHH